jgi:flavin reductase (DIM6/NTAB) family NADH-FMN oxidoreductase RutF
MPETSLTGPVPAGADPDEYDRRRRRILWSLPTGLYVLGSRSGDRRNLMTINWVTQVATAPKLLAASVEKEAVTHQLVSQGGAFSVNVLDRRDRAVVRKFVKPLEDGGDADQLAGFAVHRAATGAPILDLAVAWLDCQVHQAVDCGSHTLFLGEVLDCGGTGAEEVLRMEDTRMNYGG